MISLHFPLALSCHIPLPSCPSSHTTLSTAANLLEGHGLRFAIIDVLLAFLDPTPSPASMPAFPGRSSRGTQPMLEFRSPINRFQGTSVDHFDGGFPRVIQRPTACHNPRHGIWIGQPRPKTAPSPGHYAVQSSHPDSTPSWAMLTSQKGWFYVQSLVSPPDVALVQSATSGPLSVYKKTRRVLGAHN